MENPLPTEIVNPLIEIISYVLTFIGGVIAKWLQSRKKSTK